MIDDVPVAWEASMGDAFLVFGRPRFEQVEIDEVVDCLRSGWVGTGPKVRRFEEEFAAFKGVKDAVAVQSCTAALHLICLSLGLQAGDEVITTANTFCATVNALAYAGATPVLADIDPVTLNIAPDAIEKRITPKTKAILVVHFAGRPCEMDAIAEIARRNHLLLIEDCAHAVEGEYHGRKLGTFGDAAAFSFYATKNISCGEGGMVLARDAETLDKIRIMALHGLSADAWHRFSDEGYKHYYVIDQGFKYNMMDLQAALGIHQLSRIEQYWDQRCRFWALYQDELKAYPLELPADPAPETRHALHLYTVRIRKEQCGFDREDFLQDLTERQIGCGVHYLSMMEHPFYQQRFGWKVEDCPNAFAYGRETVSLPLTPHMSECEIRNVIEAVVRSFGNDR